MSSLVGGFEDDMAEFHNPLAAAAAGGARPFSTAAASSTTGAPVTETDDEQEWASNPLMSRSAATSFADMSAHTGRQRTASNFKANPLVNLAGAVGGSGVGGAASSSIAEDDEAAFSSNPLAQAGDGDDLGAEFGDDDGAFASNPLGGDGDDLPAAGGEHADLDEDAEFAGNAVEGVPTSSRMDVDLEDDEEHHGGAGTDEDAAAEEAELAKNAVDTTKRVPPPVMTTAAAGSAPASMVAGAGAATGVAVSVPLDRTSFTFDIYVFFALFVCTLLPFLGLPLYQRHLLPELARRQTEQAKEKKMDKLVPDVAADSDDEEGEVSTYRPLRASPEEPRSPRRVVPLATFAPSADMVRAADAMLSDDGLAPSSSSGEASGPYFAWTWESALLAAEKAAFPWLDKARKWWNAESASTEETIQHVVAVLKTDKRYLLHPHFLSVARPLLVGLSVMLMFFFLVEDVHLSLKSALLYALRFYVCGVAAFAALGAVHSEGLIDGYKSVLAIRDRELEKVKMKFVMLPADDGASASAAASSAQGVKEGKLHSSNALQLLRSIDSLSKANKSALLEKRMVWIFFICTVRACVGLHAAWTAGSGFITSVLYGAFHLASGFFFFALASQTEFELHDDQRRWHVFSAIHSAQACRKLKLPFYIPLAHLGTKSNNIQGWYAIRCYFKDLKGKFDFARVQVLLACVFVQLATCALLPLSYSYFVLGHSLPCVYAHVIADNALVAFDIALSLSLLIDLVAAGVAINRACGTHTTALQEQEMQRSFALTNPDARVEAGGEQAVVDSIAQLKALRERLTLAREIEKLRVYGVALDEHIITYLRTALVSYGVVFAQSVFGRSVMQEPAPTAKA